MVLQGEGVGSFVSRYIFSVESSFTVERLVNVSQIVDQETESKRVCKIVVVWIVPFDALVDLGLLVVLSIFTRDHRHKVRNRRSEVPGLVGQVIV